MKQFDYETSNYKHKEEIKAFVGAFNELSDKYIKSFANADADLNKISATIEKKSTSLDKLEAGLLDLNKKVDELALLKEMSNDEIRELNDKKTTISYTDSEVQKMELDDINSQITARKGKISKIEAKIDATKAKIKASNEEKKAGAKELKELSKQMASEEEALFRTKSLLTMIEETKEEINKKVLEIINVPYKVVKEEPKVEEPTIQEVPTIETQEEPAVLEEEPIAIDNDDLDVLDYTVENKIESIVEEIPVTEEDVNLDTNEIDTLGNFNEKKENSKDYDDLLDDIFRKENMKLEDFNSNVREKLVSNKDNVLKNIEVLKKHNVPLENTIDQSEILYEISSQDLDDLLSIITTDDEGNGMGFTIDFTYNILSELAKINVDKLIDVYNNEFMNVNAKSGIIYLLKLTNPELKDFEKNRRVNIEILKSLGANTVDDIIAKYPEFINMDNPLFINILNAFDRSDLVEKLNADVDVIPKIIEYWKNN